MTYMAGARLFENSQWKITTVGFSSHSPLRLGEGRASPLAYIPTPGLRSMFSIAFVLLTFMAPAIWPPEYSYSNRQSIM